MTFPYTATISASTHTNGKYLYAQTGTSKCFLQPIDAESTQLYGVTYAKGAVCYLPFDAAVEESMRLTIDGNEYGVKGIQTRNYGSLRHKKAVVSRV